MLVTNRYLVVDVDAGSKLKYCQFVERNVLRLQFWISARDRPRFLTNDSPLR